MDVTLIETNKDRKSIVCDGYRYRVDVELKSGEIAWRCTSKGCKARIRTDSSASMILQQKNPHNHERDDRQIERHVLPPPRGEQWATDFVWLTEEVQIP